MYPNKSIKLDDCEYSLKSVIEHHGEISIQGGHYTTTLLTNSGWVKCDDMRVGTSSQPDQGYVFIYERNHPSDDAAEVDPDIQTAQNEPDIETPETEFCDRCNLGIDLLDLLENDSDFEDEEAAKEFKSTVPSDTSPTEILKAKRLEMLKR